MTKIYQIYYDDSQSAFLDPDFIPFNNQGRKYPYNYEYAVFFEIFKKHDWNMSDYCGALSWKFRAKTGLTGRAFLGQISENPGYDVYFVNPFPELMVYRSVWEQGDSFHPFLKEITKLLLSEVGYDSSILEMDTPPKCLAYCNYWVANKKFWDAYMAFLEPIWSYVRSNNNVLVQALARNADPLIGAPYLPFIFERLFSTFLMINSFKVFSVPVSPNVLKKNGLLSFKIFFKDAIDETLSNRSICSNRMRLRWGFFIRKLFHYYARVYYRMITAWINGSSIPKSLTLGDIEKIRKNI